MNTNRDRCSPCSTTTSSTTPSSGTSSGRHAPSSLSASAAASPPRPSGWPSPPSTRCPTRTTTPRCGPGRPRPRSGTRCAPALATLALYVGIVETLADEADRDGVGDDALTAALLQREDEVPGANIPGEAGSTIARREVCAKCGRRTDGALHRHRHGHRAFSPNGKSRLTALVHAGVMKKVHLRHPRYRDEAACGQPYPTLLTDDRDRVSCGRCGHAGRASASKVESD